MRRAFFFIGILLLATSSFASIPRVELLDPSSPAADLQAETRIRVFDDPAPFPQPVPTLLSRELRRAYEGTGRTYASGLGRFLSVDPKMSARLQAPQSWNRYAYAWNNPLKFVDPDGLDVMLVVRNSGSGATNFGHVAIRVFGDGYDRTYDFGRYGKTWGFMKSKGEGVLRVWSNYNAFLKTQTKKGDVRVGTWQTTAEFDAAVMSEFNDRIKGGTKRGDGKGYTEYRLGEDYSLLGLNCTTICLRSLDQAEDDTGQALEGFDEIRGQNDPNDVFDEMEAVFGPNYNSLMNLMDSLKKP